MGFADFEPRWQPQSSRPTQAVKIESRALDVRLTVQAGFVAIPVAQREEGASYCLGNETGRKPLTDGSDLVE